MNTKDITKVHGVLRNMSVEPHLYIDCYREICQGILNTTPLCDMWEDALRAIVSGEGLVEWGRNWNSIYSLRGEYGWIWAIRWIAASTLEEAIEEFSD